ncbi:isoprenyl transferase [Chlamydiota bacterium]
MNDLPKHVAIIMDGNGRWANRQGLSRIEGHRAGIGSVRDVVRSAREVGIKFLTLYSFSIENWKRPRKEIRALMNLLKQFLVDELDEMNENQIRLCSIGRIDGLPKSVRDCLKSVQDATKKNSELTLVLALNYSAKAEILDAINALFQDYNNTKITERIFAKYLYTKEIPDPDLLIRTSGEMRMSNFLLWQLSYSELYFTETLWPDFRENEFKKALECYKKRERRFGGLKRVT